METQLQDPVKPSKSRCGECKKKLGLLGFDCRCGGHFCGLHRIAEAHRCSYDYAASHQKYLSTALDKVVGKKVEVL